jgi:hypothetical protein
MPEKIQRTCGRGSSESGPDPAPFVWNWVGATPSWWT